MATIIKQTKEEINGAEIARARELGALDKLLAERDVIRFNLRSGSEVAIMVEKVEPGRAWMGFVDGVAERPMYERLLVRPVSWKESDARKWCNTDLVQDLPEDLVSIITPRTIRQTVEDKELVTTDLLWLHSATEFFGRRPWASGDDPTEEQLPVYKTERDRVKMWNEETWPHYTRSAGSGLTHSFCLVTINGTATSTNANNSWAVAPGFHNPARGWVKRSRKRTGPFVKGEILPGPKPETALCGPCTDAACMAGLLCYPCFMCRGYAV